jgi:molybdate transport system ATP-binding protein
MTAPSLREGLKVRLHGRLGRFELDAAFQTAPTGITALVGPSGSGKTTVLRCIAGLTRLAGEVALDGQVWQDGGGCLPAHKRPVGFVFQDAGLLAHLSVKGNLLYAQKRAGQAGRAVAWDEVVELLGLGPLLDRSTANLSGGERQRAALGRALLSRPRILLMDEPLASLDAEAKAEILTYLERLHPALSIPALYVSHDPAEVARLADRVLTLRAGRVTEPAAGGPSPEDRLAGMSGEQRDALALAALKAGLDRS